MKTRIKEARKAKKLTQQELADLLNVKKATIEALEQGKREATARIQADICRELNVNREWLETGEGDMFNPLSREEEIAEIAATIYKEEDAFKRNMIAAICALDEEQIKLLKDIAKKLLEE